MTPMDFFFAASAAVFGYVIGSIPTAGWLARLRGIDLTKEGSRNPGANNALRSGGASLAAAVLIVEMAKGSAIGLAGALLAGDWGLVLAGLTGVTGNLYNVWYRFRGGKGLGITAGLLLVAWPMVVAPIVVVIAAATWATRSTGGGTIIALVAMGLAGVTWPVADLPVGWGINAGLVPVLAIGLGLLIAPKHLPEARFKRSSPAAPR